VQEIESWLENKLENKLVLKEKSQEPCPSESLIMYLCNQYFIMRESILICESHIEWNMLGLCTPVMHCNDCWLLHNYILDMHFQFDQTISVLSIDFRMIWAHMGWR